MGVLLKQTSAGINCSLAYILCSVSINVSVLVADVSSGERFCLSSLFSQVTVQQNLLVVFKWKPLGVK